MVRKPLHKRAFKRGMREGAFGWRGSANAIERLRSASSEIRAVDRQHRLADIGARAGHRRALHCRESRHQDADQGNGRRIPV